MSIRTDQMMSFERAKIVATEILAIRMKRPAAYRVVKSVVFLSIVFSRYIYVFRPYFGLVSIPSIRFEFMTCFMSWFVASDHFRQSSLL